ncbi:hypothetical protein [Bacillus sp. E214]|uniref:hypothetical protein n=1 Tax=Bacillus sp. E214 TaxID=2587156 RepID=UPI0011DF8DBF|nr:hypothetical protein [Bacillus sp. E214]
MRNKLVKKLFVVFAIFFVLLQSISIPLAAASWTGDAWKGDAWKGDAWNGNDLQWEGETWKGDSWKQKGWVQDGWERDGWTQEGWDQDNWNQDGWTGDGVSPIDPATGKPWTGDKINGINPATGKPWTGDDISGINPATGKPWTGDDISGINPATGKPWTGDDISGINPATGKPWTGDDISGINPATGKPWTNGETNGINPETGKPWSNEGIQGSSPAIEGNGQDKIDIDPYEATKFIMNDVIGGQVKGAYEIESGKFSLLKPNSFAGILLNGIKLGVGDSSGYNYLHGGYEIADKVYTGIDGITDARKYRNLIQSGQDLSTFDSIFGSSTNPPPSASFGMLSKLNVGAAGISTVFSTIDTVKNGISTYDSVKENGWRSAKTVAAGADTTASIGEVLMNSGVVAGAIPGGQLVGAYMVAGGAVLWGASKLVKGIADGSIKKGVKKVGEKIGSMFNSIKGVFS